MISLARVILELNDHGWCVLFERDDRIRAYSVILRKANKTFDIHVDMRAIKFLKHDEHEAKDYVLAKAIIDHGIGSGDQDLITPLLNARGG